MKFNAYGRKIEVIKSDKRWSVFYLGEEGRKRIADDILIPSDIEGNDIASYIEDLLHEYATSINDRVVEIE